MKRFLIPILLILAAYAAGFWIEHRKQAAVQGELARQQARLGELEERVRAGELLGLLLNLKDVAAARDYGQAQGLSTRFFDATRLEAGRVARTGGLAASLDAVLAMRDPVTAALTRSDPASIDILREAERRLRRGLGYPVPPAEGPAPAPSASPAAAPAN